MSKPARLAFFWHQSFTPTHAYTCDVLTVCALSIYLRLSRPLKTGSGSCGNERYRQIDGFEDLGRETEA